MFNVKCKVNVIKNSICCLWKTSSGSPHWYFWEQAHDPPEPMRVYSGTSLWTLRKGKDGGSGRLNVSQELPQPLSVSTSKQFSLFWTIPDLSFPLHSSFHQYCHGTEGLMWFLRVSPSGFPGHSDGLSPACFLQMVEKDLACLPFFLG